MIWCFYRMTRFWLETSLQHRMEEGRWISKYSMHSLNSFITANNISLLSPSALFDAKGSKCKKCLSPLGKPSCSAEGVDAFKGSEVLSSLRVFLRIWVLGCICSAQRANALLLGPLMVHMVHTWPILNSGTQLRSVLGIFFSPREDVLQTCSRHLSSALSQQDSDLLNSLHPHAFPLIGKKHMPSESCSEAGCNTAIALF